MTLKQLFLKIWPFVKPYRWLVVLTLLLTLVGSLMAQVNAVVLDRSWFFGTGAAPPVDHR